MQNTWTQMLTREPVSLRSLLICVPLRSPVASLSTAVDQFSMRCSAERKRKSLNEQVGLCARCSAPYQLSHCQLGPDKSPRTTRRYHLTQLYPQEEISVACQWKTDGFKYIHQQHQ